MGHSEDGERWSVSVQVIFCVFFLLFFCFLLGQLQVKCSMAPFTFFGRVQQAISPANLCMLQCVLANVAPCRFCTLVVKTDSPPVFNPHGYPCGMSLAFYHPGGNWIVCQQIRRYNHTGHGEKGQKLKSTPTKLVCGTVKPSLNRRYSHVAIHHMS